MKQPLQLTTDPFRVMDACGGHVPDEDEKAASMLKKYGLETDQKTLAEARMIQSCP